MKFLLVIALFFAVRLNKAKLPDWVDWILTAYVIFHVLTHLILTVRIFSFAKSVHKILKILKSLRENRNRAILLTQMCKDHNFDTKLIN